MKGEFRIKIRYFLFHKLYMISKKQSLSYLHLPEAVVGHFVHKAVEQSGGTSFVHSELSLRSKVVTFLGSGMR